MQTPCLPPRNFNQSVWGAGTRCLTSSAETLIQVSHRAHPLEEKMLREDNGRSRGSLAHPVPVGRQGISTRGSTGTPGFWKCFRHGNKQTNALSDVAGCLSYLHTGKGCLQVCMAHRSPRPPGKKRSQPTEQTAGRDDAPWGLGATGGQQGLGTAGRGPPAAVQQHT